MRALYPLVRLHEWLKYKRACMCVNKQFSLDVPLLYLLTHDISKITTKKYEPYQAQFLLDMIYRKISFRLENKISGVNDSIKYNWAFFDMTKIEIRAMFCAWFTLYYIKTGEFPQTNTSM
jgi:hypothetical protein